MNKYIECPRCGKMWKPNRDKDCPDKLEPEDVEQHLTHGVRLLTQEEKENREQYLIDMAESKREECDSRDYDAVTKGVVSLINLIRRHV